MEHLVADLRMQSRFRDNIHLALEDLFVFSLQATRKERRSLGPAVDEKIEVAPGLIRTARNRAEHAHVHRAVASSGFEQQIALRFEYPLGAHAQWSSRDYFPSGTGGTLSIDLLAISHGTGSVAPRSPFSIVRLQ